jgi:hypothetical protein
VAVAGGEAGVATEEGDGAPAVRSAFDSHSRAIHAHPTNAIAQISAITRRWPSFDRPIALYRRFIRSPDLEREGRGHRAPGTLQASIAQLQSLCVPE